MLEDARTAKSSRVTVYLKDGRELARECETFKGTPDQPLTREELRRKFMLLTADMGEAAAARLCDRLERIDTEPRFSLV